MKAYYLALGFLIMNVVFGMLDAADFLDIGVAYDKELIEDWQGWYDSNPEYSKPLSDEKEFVSQDSESLDTGKGYLSIIMRSLVPTILLVDVFGINIAIAILINVIIYLIYAVAILQSFGLFPGGKSTI